MKHTLLFNGLITLLLSAGIVEGTSIRPGVWEYTTTIKSQNGEMEKAMAQMDRITSYNVCYTKLLRS